jgi:hypothetical protein
MLAQRLRLLPPLIVTTSLAVTLAACATQPRTEVSILDVIANEPRAAGPACNAQTEAVVCQSAGLRSRLDRRCTCIDRAAFQ